MGDSPWVVRCRNCGFEKTFRDRGTGISPERSAKAAKAGHIGGGSPHYEHEDRCEDVVVEPARLEHLLESEDGVDA